MEGFQFDLLIGIIGYQTLTLRQKPFQIVSKARKLNVYGLFCFW
jgi:hypothetical protein